MGSSLEARVAGSHTASSATAPKMTGTVTNTIGSQDFTPKRTLARRRVSPNAAQIPRILSSPLDNREEKHNDPLDSPGERVGCLKNPVI